MKIVPGPLPLCLFCVMLAASDCAAQLPPAAVATGPKVDRYGDPLPEKALVRLGTVRLRHGQSVEGVVLSPEGRTPATAELFGAELTELRNKLVALEAERDRNYQQEQLIQEGKQTHGRVWLFLRAAK
jgi:hypothetical protein